MSLPTPVYKKIDIPGVENSHLYKHTVILNASEIFGPFEFQHQVVGDSIWESKTRNGWVWVEKDSPGLVLGSDFSLKLFWGEAELMESYSRTPYTRLKQSPLIDKDGWEFLGLVFTDTSKAKFLPDFEAARFIMKL